MLTINQCRALLKADKNKLTDEQVMQIRDFMYHLADIAIDGLNSEANKTEVKKKTNNTK